MADAKHSGSGWIGRGGQRTLGRFAPVRRLGPAGLLLALASLTAPAGAQEAARPNVSINHDVLNSLAARPPLDDGGASSLLPAPEGPLRSRLLVKPKRVVKAERPPRPPQGRPAGLLAKLAPKAAVEPPAASSPVGEPTLELPVVPPPPGAPSADTTAADTAPLQPPPLPPAPLAIPDPPPAPRVAAPQPPPQAPPLQEAARPLDDPPPDSKTKSKGKTPGDALTARILFESGSATLSDKARAALAELASDLPAAASGRITLKSYSAGEKRAARRLSLSRAHAIRSFLVDKGVASTRIDVRPLGATTVEGPADRVDIIAAKR